MLVLGLAAPLAGQRATPRVIDWPVRSAASPEALIPGARAAFWNPAGVGELAARGEVSVLDIVGPDGTGLDALSAAGAVRVGERAALGIGLAHFGLGGIPRTTTSPVPDPGAAEIRVSEQEGALAGAWSLAPSLQVGAGLRWARAELADRHESRTGAVVGASWRTPLPLEPRVAASVLRQGGAHRWLLGARASLPRPEDRPWTLSGEYGVSGGEARRASAHRVLLEGGWKDRLQVAVAAAGEPAGSELEWLPMVAADLRLGRYLLGIVREQLPNGFGAAYSYRLDITF